jgi:hypothetical protein
MSEPLDLEPIRERYQEWEALSDAGNTATWAFSESTAAMLLAGNDVPRLIADVDQIRYERRLLGMARMVLDHVAEMEVVQNSDETVAARAADVAQRIVDEIGHPVTDEPALGESFRQQIAAVRQLHRGPRTERHGSGCVQCGIVWPCPTIRALNGEVA